MKTATLFFFSSIVVTASAAFAPVPRPAIIRIVTLNENDMERNNDSYKVKTYEDDAPEPEFGDDDTRKSISAAPSFEEYMKSRSNVSSNNGSIKNGPKP